MLCRRAAGRLLKNEMSASCHSWLRRVVRFPVPGQARGEKGKSPVTKALEQGGAVLAKEAPRFHQVNEIRDAFAPVFHHFRFLSGRRAGAQFPPKVTKIPVFLFNTLEGPK